MLSYDIGRAECVAMYLGGDADILEIFGFGADSEKKGPDGKEQYVPSKYGNGPLMIAQSSLYRVFVHGSRRAAGPGAMGPQVKGTPYHPNPPVTSY